MIAGLQALAPPLKWDSLAYHLELPQRYIEAGRIAYLSDNLFVGFPQLAEMIFTWATALGSGSTAATAGWIISVIAILGLGGFAERQVGKGYRWLASAILMSGASISRGLSWAYVDLWVLFFGLGTIIFFEQYARTKKLIWVGIAAVLAGLGCLGKNNMLVAPQYGPRVRLRTMLTDVALPATGPIDFDPCEECDIPCRPACPQKAFGQKVYSIKDLGTDLLPARSGVYSQSLCNRQMLLDRSTSVSIRIEGEDAIRNATHYCRLCESSCPVGQ